MTTPTSVPHANTAVLDLHQRTLTRIITNHIPNTSVVPTGDTITITVPAGTPDNVIDEARAEMERNGYPTDRPDAAPSTMTVPSANLPRHPYEDLPPNARATLDTILTVPQRLSDADTNAWMNLVTAITHLRFTDHHWTAVEVLNDLAFAAQPAGGSLPIQRVGPMPIPCIPDIPAN